MKREKNKIVIYTVTVQNDMWTRNLSASLKATEHPFWPWQTFKALVFANFCCSTHAIEGACHSKPILACKIIQFTIYWQYIKNTHTSSIESSVNSFVMDFTKSHCISNKKKNPKIWFIANLKKRSTFLLNK